MLIQFLTGLLLTSVATPFWAPADKTIQQSEKELERLKGVNTFVIRIERPVPAKVFSSIVITAYLHMKLRQSGTVS